jgi:FeS assembly SUF system protein
MVLNQTAPADSSEYLLEDAGLFPDQTLEEGGSLESSVVSVLRTINDPEIPLNVYDLGLVYRVDVGDSRRVEIDMTLTSPGCPVAGILLRQVHDAIRKIPSVTTVCTRLVWEPTWTKDRMSEAAQFELGLL